ncbi:MAG: diguanylate cyclase [Campylobacterota bacterium]|nr:diguanylate cyclase [Campylobacterota bacterium]
MSSIDNVVKATLINLAKKKKNATPNEYHKEFCNVSQSMNLSFSDCTLFKELVSKLNKEEQTEIENNNIETSSDLIPVLLNRIATKNLDKLASLINDSMTPSISLEIDDKLAKFSVKIGNSPSMMFEEDIQNEIQSFITKRFEADKTIVKQKTSDIAKLVTLMGQYLNDAITSSGRGETHVSDIKDKIEAIEIHPATDHEDLSLLQSQLINAAISIENEMANVGKKMQDGKSQVDVMQDEIHQLKADLQDARRESELDHLTGLLTRRAFEKEMDRIESEYTRLGHDYAVVFYDLDYFKNINDTYGHDGGDVILSTFAKILKQQTRDLDIVCRYGGEEFVAVIHYTLKRDLLKYLKRVKNIMQKNKFVYNNQKIKMTYSAGVATRDQHNNYADAIQSADMLLYKAKESGRDKIILSDGTEL